MKFLFDSLFISFYTTGEDTAANIGDDIVERQVTSF